MDAAQELFLGVFDDLIRAETLLWDGIDERMATALGLPLSRFEPMRIMATTPDCRVSDVAEQLSITMGGASKLVERIRAAGFCERTANPADGRSSYLRLTPAGVAALRRAQRLFDAELRARLGDALPADRLGTFASMLHELRDALRPEHTTPTDDREEPRR